MSTEAALSREEFEPDIEQHEMIHQARFSNDSRKHYELCSQIKFSHKINFRIIFQPTFENFSNFCQHPKDNIKDPFQKKNHTGSNDYRTALTTSQVKRDSSK